jgi:hypothetical protein
MPRNGDPDAPLFQERLTVPVLWWVIATLGVGIGGAEVFAGFRWVIVVLVYVVLAVPTVAILLATGHLSVVVDANGLHAAGITLPPSAMGEIRRLDRQETRRVLGPGADRTAHMVARGYVAESVAIRTPDLPDCPYWLVSSRRPAELAATLESVAARSPRGSTTTSDSPSQ